MSKNGLRMVVRLNFDITHLSPPSNIICTRFYNIFIRYHCAIETEEEVVLTGGYYSQSLVTKYNIEGQAEALPSLITGRYNHACGKIARTDGSIVSLGTWWVRNYIYSIALNLVDLYRDWWERQWWPISFLYWDPDEGWRNLLEVSGWIAI